MRGITLCCLMLLGVAQGGYVNSFSIGADCDYDEHCETPNSYCKMQQRCDCKVGYEYDSEKDYCFPSELGQLCREDWDCSMLKEAACVNYNCSCRQDWVVASDSKSCLPLARINMECLEDTQCLYNTDNSFCNATKQCQCKPNYHEASGPLECIQNIGLGAQCEFARECYVDEDHDVEALVCEPSDNNVRSCGCADGFTREGSRCAKDNAASLVLSVAVLSLAAIVNCVV